MAFPTLSIDPEYPLVEDREDSVIRTEFEGGYTNARRRFSRSRRKWTLNYKNLLPADKTLLTTFVDTTIAGGATSFDWTNPATSETITVLLVKPPVFSLDTYSDDGYLYSTTIELQEV